MTTRHLDLGCGARPRNPYRRDGLFGVDLAAPAGSSTLRAAKLVLHPVPFDTSSFASEALKAAPASP